MKIKPVILCGGAGTRLWPKSKHYVAKQFIDFGGWNLFERTLDRIKNSMFDSPIISTNSSYLQLVKKYLQKNKFYKYNIILEPSKKNTATAILSSALIHEVSFDQPMIFFPADHLIEKTNQFNKELNFNTKYLDDDNIFIFGIKPQYPSSQYGYFLTKKTSKGINIVTKFIEKPSPTQAEQIIKKKGYWNSGILFANKISIINNFSKHQNKTLNFCIQAVLNSTRTKNLYFLSKIPFKKIVEKSFDHAILEKSKNINGIKLNIPWSDLGSWNEISNIFQKNKSKYLKKNNVFYRPWGKYTNLFKGKGFLIKELVINPKSSISLQKHNHRSEHWSISSGTAKITISNRKFTKKAGDTVFISKGSVHRIENPYKKPVTIMEAQIGSILKETDITRYKDLYGRVR